MILGTDILTTVVVIMFLIIIIIIIVIIIVIVIILIGIIIIRSIAITIEYSRLLNNQHCIVNSLSC